MVIQSKMQRAKSKETDKRSKITLKVRAYHFAIGITRMLDKLPSDYITQTIAKQLIRSATSIGANVIEAQAASSKRDFVNFLNYALKSSNETKFWLGLLGETRGHKDLISPLLTETQAFSRILGASILTAKGKRQF